MILIERESENWLKEIDKIINWLTKRGRYYNMVEREKESINLLKEKEKVL